MQGATLEKVMSSPKLPTLPTVAARLLDLTRDPEVELSDIEAVVQYDAALSAKILRTVNSSYYRLSQPCPTIRRALAYLGLSTVRSLVLGFTLVDVARRCRSDFDLVDYWRRCVYSAAAARRIALVTGSCDPDEAFVAALMQDIGMLALHAVLGDHYARILSEIGGNHGMLPRCETSTLGFNHADAGAHLGERWSLPEQVVDPIRQHHMRGTPFGRHRAIVNAVILAYRISNLMTLAERKPALDMVSAMSQTMFHMSPDDERAVLVAATEDASELSALLEVNVGELPDMERLLAEADALAGGNGQAAAQPPAGRPAAAQMLTDSVTGIGNRRRFDEALAVHFERDVAEQRPIAVAMAGVDRIESITQSLGAATADAALRAVAQRLAESFGSAGVVCRYGSDTFAVLLPETSRIQAARMAERARRHVEQESVDLRETSGPAEAVQVTASFGVAALDRDLAGRVTAPEALVALAEKSLAAARTAGPNTVRVHAPREAA